MNVDEFFPHQFCINLNTRRDRWERMTEKFARQEINRVVRFPALDGNRLEVPSHWRYSSGAYGCLRSHLAVVEQARDEACPSVLIFEDDVIFAPDFTTRFAEYIRQLPDDWDMVFFGALHGQPLVKATDNLLRINHSLSTYAYALKDTTYDSFIELNRQALTVLDENTRALQKRFNSYCFIPHLAWVEEDYSDVRGEKVNLWWLEESLVLYGPEIDEILKKTVAVVSCCNHKPGSLRNLRFLSDYLLEELPDITVLVLEHGAGVNRSDLPRDCRLEKVRDCVCSDRSLSIKRILEMFESSKEFFILLDSDVFLASSDIRANLLKSRDYDLVSSFREIYDLDERDTLRILGGDARLDYDGHYRPRRKTALCDSAFIATRKGLRALLENDQRSEDHKSLRFYDSPNRARRLWSR
jgi:GR25 family glycosyltransferase involved in LPS biosynthesis